MNKSDASMSLQVDLKGAVNSLKLGTKEGALLPVFEAVSNAIHAIQDRRKQNPDWQEPGRVTVSIKRAGTLLAGNDDNERIAAIEGVEISDNGIGFDDTNMESFKHLYTSHKATRGARGTGRLLWLKAYSRAEIESRHRHNGELRIRRFRFEPTGIGELRDERAPGQDANTGSTIRLIGCRAEFAHDGLKQVAAIAKRLLEDCLEYFIVGDAPEIVVTDGANRYSVNDLYGDLRDANVQETAVEVGGAKLKVEAAFFKSKAPEQQQLHLCAGRRSIVRIPLSEFGEALAKPLADQGQPRVLVVCVSGALLDDAVNNERTAFDLPQDGALVLDSRPSLPAIKKALAPWITETVQPYAQAAEQERNQRLERFIEENPWYRILGGTYRARLSKVRTDLGDRTLDSDLFRVMQEIRAEVRAEMQSVVRGLEAEADAGVAERTEALAAKVSDLAKSDLARYVCERRAVLDILKHLLARQPDGRHAKEAAVHDLVFPMRTTSDAVPEPRNHLWLIDERLSFHRVLRSDLVTGPSRKRADLIVGQSLKGAVLAGDETTLNRVAIVEFKRPERDDFGPDDDPIRQVLDYVDEAREQGVEDGSGLRRRVGKDARFDCYIVASLTPGLRRQARINQMIPTGDDLGFFCFHTNVGAYVEIIDLLKLQSDADKRNAAILDKLGLRM